MQMRLSTSDVISAGPLARPEKLVKATDVISFNCDPAGGVRHTSGSFDSEPCFSSTRKVCRYPLHAQRSWRCQDINDTSPLLQYALTSIPGVCHKKEVRAAVHCGTADTLRVRRRQRRLRCGQACAPPSRSIAVFQTQTNMNHDSQLTASHTCAGVEHLHHARSTAREN